MINKPKIPLIIPGEPALKENEFIRLKKVLMFHFIFWCLVLIFLVFYWSELNNIFKYAAAIILGIFVPDLGIFKFVPMKYTAYIAEWENKNT